MEGLKPGVLLELGFDAVTPNHANDISCSLYDYAAQRVEIIATRFTTAASRGSKKCSARSANG
jgi:hypothetical protein